MVRRIFIALALTLCTTCGGPPPAEHVAQRSAILITLDTTRADAFDAFGGAHHVTPVLDGLAAESVCYRFAHSVAPLTLPAHTSMFTGLYPPQHTVRGNGPAMVPEGLTLLAERAAAAGAQTAAFIGGLSLDRAYGIARGFETWTQPKQDPTCTNGLVSSRPASAVVADARAWFAKRDRSRPFFLWVHVFDAHARYEPPRSFLDLAGGDPYLGEIATYDAALGLLIADLRREKVLDEALLVVLADHGEARGDHGEDTHGCQTFESTLHIPFFVRHPDGARKGEHTDEPACSVDVAPTMLEWLRLPPLAAGDCDGVSLLHPVPEGRGSYFEAYSGWARFGWSPLVGWVDREAKFVYSTKPRLFRLVDDPGEEHDVLAQAPREAERGRERVRWIFERGPAKAIRPRLASISSDAIAALGYGENGEFEPEYPDPFTVTDLPPPFECLDEYNEFADAQNLNILGKHAEAASKLERVIAANPRCLDALDEWAASLIELKQWQRAVEVLQDRVRRPPERTSTHQKLVRCYTELGDKEKTREHALRVLDLLIEASERRNDSVQAEHFRKLRADGRANGAVSPTDR